MNCAFMRKALPELCTTARLSVVSPPMNNANPTMPSFPMMAISADCREYLAQVELDRFEVWRPKRPDRPR
jgi:hypothetical protein